MINVVPCFLSGVMQLLDFLFQFYLQDFEIQAVFESLIWSLVKGYWYGPVKSCYQKQVSLNRRVLLMVTCVFAVEKQPVISVLVMLIPC